MNDIPGSSVLGCGFNVLGEYGVSSVTRRIFKNSGSGKAYKFQPTGIEYNVPDNFRAVSALKTYGISNVFQTQRSFETYFSAKAKISGNYGAFEAEFSTAYASESENIQDYYYALYDAAYIGWKLILENQSSEQLDPSFITDPDFQNLPTKFTKDNKESFFRFFKKYGTHYVGQVSAGGNMRYYTAIEKSFSSNMETLETNVELEYKALFFSVKSESKTEWKQLTKKWTESRKSSLHISGGDISGLRKLQPAFGDSDCSQYSDWFGSVMENPAVVDFDLVPISNLFSGSQSDAVDQAIYAYNHAILKLDAAATYMPFQGQDGCPYVSSSTINLCGNLVVPNPNTPKPPPFKQRTGLPTVTGGLQFALIDPLSADVLLSKIYYQKIPYTERQMYKDALLDIEAFENSANGEISYICAISAFALDLEDYPTPEFSSWLVGCGATMHLWKKWLGYTSSAGHLCYTMIGQKGLEEGFAKEQLQAKASWGHDIESVSATVKQHLHCEFKQ